MASAEELFAMIEQMSANALDGDIGVYLARKALTQLNEQGGTDYEIVSEVLMQFPDLREEEALPFVKACREANLNWRLDAYPAINETQEGRRSVKPVEFSKVITDAFDQWCRALNTTWDVSHPVLVDDNDTRNDFGCVSTDILVRVYLRDFALNTVYARDMERFVTTALDGFGMTMQATRNMWFAKAGEPPGPTVTVGYGVWWTEREVHDPKYKMRPVDYATKRATRQAMQRRAPHAISQRRQIELSPEIAEVLSEVVDMTPEEVAERWARNAKLLGRREYNHDDLI